MRARAHRLLFWALGAQAILACSLITDYALDANTGGPDSDAAPNDATGLADTPSTDDVTTVVDPDSGPACTATPCVVQIAAAVRNTCARLDDGVVKCWGWNQTGVVGAAQAGANFATPQTVALDGPADEIAMGGWPESDATACARRGAIVDCWGDDNGRMLGRGATTANEQFNPAPGPVANLTGATGGIGIGGIRVCVRVGDALSCWGDDYSVTTGQGVIESSATPFAAPRPVKQIAGGRAHHCALFDNEEVACVGHAQWYGPMWNDAGYGRGPSSATWQTIGGVTGIAQIALLTNHTCALKKTGVVLCWGRNRRGELGRGSTSNVDMNPAPVTLPRAAKYIGSGGKHMCAILDDDSLWCWGSNDLFGFDSPVRRKGQIGALPDGGLDDLSASPRMVEGLPPCG
jgi:alpha-tubulin suppressor-like RCC1 family protein